MKLKEINPQIITAETTHKFKVIFLKNYNFRITEKIIVVMTQVILQKENLVNKLKL